ncbi:MAG: Gmad2 immunoglobulin-like domain-containing protein [Myxococcota bacterium]|nr:Gmad2 immunoglobulin-like domain-containing protein [Myxococcota bacterium]
MILLLLACAGTPPVAETPEPVPELPQVALESGPVGEAQVQELERQPPATPIALTQPAEGAVISGEQLVVAGAAQVFEGHLTVRVTRGDEVLTDATVLVAAAPDFGEFELSVPVTPGPAKVEVYSRSARDGSPENLVTRSVVIQ